MGDHVLSGSAYIRFERRQNCLMSLREEADFSVVGEVQKIAHTWHIHVHVVYSDITVISLASLLHDADDHKLFNTENNLNARNFLKSQNIEGDMIERICEVINGVSFSKNRGKRPETLEGKIVQDADRLDAMGAIGIARTFAYGGKCGRSLDSSLQHFYDKLLLLKDELNTQEAKKIAEIRHEYMQGFLNEIQEEINTK